MSRPIAWTTGAAAVLLVAAAAFLMERGGAPVPPSAAAAATESPPPEPALVAASLFELLQPVSLANCTLERFGEPNDGGYLVCANLLGSVRSGYSYGISGYDGFGCEVSRRLHIRVHEYDCFDLRQPACPGGDLQFHAACVGPEPASIEGRLFDTIANQIAANGDAGRRLIFKIDVEGAEWESFMAAPDSVYEQIDQLVVEFHGVDDPRFLETMKRLTRFFHVAHLHFNNYSCNPELAPFPASVYEVLLVNRRLGVIDPGGARPSRPHPLDAPNNPDAPDCQGGAS